MFSSPEKDAHGDTMLKNVWMQRTTQRRIKLLELSVARSLVKEILVLLHELNST